MLYSQPHLLSMRVRRTAQARLLQAGVAVERRRLEHGKYPERLEDLVPEYLEDVPADPFDSAALRYRTSEKGFVVYSVDSDGNDDGGVEFEGESGRRFAKDITFRVER